MKKVFQVRWSPAAAFCLASFSSLYDEPAADLAAAAAAVVVV
eukprot:CAMPEP_0175062844 /NCGR_PEP_ID=MMETSP0052_2-20121109/14400_1 /TAXON_ID=51329 ORGANISM="Polytomella parva, Strain SAG 63-3" /NCGR_SAMPLE_ID=MMETSP0052_2 /ASSEMBLY_ACC=CAM_ASM_000194 /LENGTH=41 /DNA_ID= /DNA_START= /DNA_END= /DNA_ORIENTATION=